MTTTKTGSLTDVVRQYAAVQTTVSRKQTREALGLAVSQVDYVFKDLLAQGWLVKVQSGVYAFQDVSRFSREAPIEDRIWKAMRINPHFSAADIARQSGSTDNYVAKKLRQYRDAGWVVHRRSQSNISGTGRVKVWSLTLQGRDRLERPVLEAYRPDPLIESAVKLNRLVCTGVATRRRVDHAKAIALCDQIKTMLSESGDSHE